MTDRLVRVLRLLGCPSAEEMADALWLAELMGPDERRLESPGAPGPSQITASAARPAGSVRHAPWTAERELIGALPVRDAIRVDPRASSRLTTRRSYLIRSPAASDIRAPLALTRALRPLRMTAPSPTGFILDEEGTAHRVAETRIWSPVLRPAAERWLCLILVVDTSPSMVVWRHLADELAGLLSQLGAFRDVRVWWLDTHAEQLRLTTAGRTSRSPRQLIDPTGRSLILVLSDCVGLAWRDGRAASLLRAWGRSGPAAVMQTLPEHLWRRTAAVIEPVLFDARGQATSNDRLIVRPVRGAVLPSVRFAAPVLELEPHGLASWASMLANGGSGIRGAALFPHDPEPTQPVTSPPPTALDRVIRFRAASSPEAFRLACYLAAAPTTLPMMRLVQRALLPWSESAQLAEVLLGGLLRSAGAEDAYEFHDGVRALLLSGLRRAEALYVLREVWKVTRDRIGSPHDFPSLLDSIQDGTGTLPREQPFTRVSAQVLARLGGRYQEIARRLETTAGPAATRFSTTALPARSERRSPRLPPAVWGEVPARDPGFVGREKLLTSIRETLEKAIVVLIPPPGHELGGEGRTQLAAEYAHRYHDEYDLVWWVRADRPGAAWSGLARLAARLGAPPDGGYARGMVDHARRALRDGIPYPRWLLVFDDAADHAALRPLLPETGPTADVLITARTGAWSEVGTPIEVSSFDRADSVTLLRRRISGITPAQADNLAELACDLPLALAQAAAWHTGGGQVPHYLERFDERLAEGSDAADICTELALERMRAESRQAGRLLALWSCFGAEPVPVQLLATAARVDPPAGLAGIPADDRTLRDSMRVIERFALGRFDPETGSLQVHLRVRTMLQARQSTAERVRVRAYVHAILAAATPAEPPEDKAGWESRAQITPHVEPTGLVAGEAAWVVLDQARFRCASGDFEGGRRLAELIVERYGTDDPRALNAPIVLATAYRGLGMLQAAAELSETLFTRRRSRYGAHDDATLEAAHDRAVDLRISGEFQQAYALDTETWQLHGQRHGSEHPATLFSAGHVCLDLRLLGEVHKAYAVDLDVFRAAPSFQAAHQLALDLHGLGRYAEALGRHPDPADAPDTTLALAAQAAQAGMLRASGDIEAAVEVAGEAVAGHLGLLGPDHPNTLAATAGLALAKIAAGSAREARELLDDVVAGCLRTLGSDHPFIGIYRAGLAVALRAIGDVQAAAELDRPTWPGLRGDHPWVLCSAVGRASDLYLLGERAAAAELAARTLDRLTARLGANHPHTLACARNNELIRGLETGGDLLDCIIEPVLL
jgi:tetratricopeptide (TPR) repeat protein